MNDKFTCQYGIKKVIFEITIDEIEPLIGTDLNSKCYGDNLHRVLQTIANHVYWTDFIGVTLPIKGVVMKEIKDEK